MRALSPSDAQPIVLLGVYEEGVAWLFVVSKQPNLDPTTGNLDPVGWLAVQIRHFTKPCPGRQG